MRIFYTVGHAVILEGGSYITANLLKQMQYRFAVLYETVSKRKSINVVPCQFQKSERVLQHYHREKCTLIIHLSLSVSMSIMLCTNKCLFSMHYRENIHFSSNAFFVVRDGGRHLCVRKRHSPTNLLVISNSIKYVLQNQDIKKPSSDLKIQNKNIYFFI